MMWQFMNTSWDGLDHFQHENGPHSSVSALFEHLTVRDTTQLTSSQAAHRALVHGDETRREENSAMERSVERKILSQRA